MRIWIKTIKIDIKKTVLLPGFNNNKNRLATE
jgi:hypothetical protein